MIPSPSLSSLPSSRRRPVVVDVASASVSPACQILPGALSGLSRRTPIGRRQSGVCQLTSARLSSGYPVSTIQLDPAGASPDSRPAEAPSGTHAGAPRWSPTKPRPAAITAGTVRRGRFTPADSGDSHRREMNGRIQSDEPSWVRGERAASDPDREKTTHHAAPRRAAPPAGSANIPPAPTRQIARGEGEGK